MDPEKRTSLQNLILNFQVHPLFQAGYSHWVHQFILIERSMEESALKPTFTFPKYMQGKLSKSTRLGCERKGHHFLSSSTTNHLSVMVTKQVTPNFGFLIIG